MPIFIDFFVSVLQRVAIFHVLGVSMKRWTIGRNLNALCVDIGIIIFPSICWLLHSVLLKLYPKVYQRRESQVAGMFYIKVWLVFCRWIILYGGLVNITIDSLIGVLFSHIILGCLLRRIAYYIRDYHFSKPICRRFLIVIYERRLVFVST